MCMQGPCVGRLLQAMLSLPAWLRLTAPQSRPTSGASTAIGRFLLASDCLRLVVQTARPVPQTRVTLSDGWGDATVSRACYGTFSLWCCCAHYVE